MDLFRRRYYPMYMMLAVYLACSLPLFNNVYKTIKVVIDEKFHIPQAQAYCIGKYDVWDSKITTLPGLYIATAKVLSAFAHCTTYNLRFFNLVVSTINIGLFYVILKIVYRHSCGRYNLVLQALNLGLLPPLYFFAHIFYTDVLSLMSLLLFTISVIKRTRFVMLALALFSIGCRQTNCIWVFMLFAQKSIETIIKTSRVYGNEYVQRKKYNNNPSMAHVLDPSTLRRCYGLKDVFYAIGTPIKTLYKSLMFNKELEADFKCTIELLIPNVIFFIFVCVNGSIVIGDKAAHTLTVHVPQLLYFMLFYGFFGLPFVLFRLKPTLKFMWGNKVLVLAILILSSLAVHFNTLVHPYLLADNRHYTFYIWNRWFGKYPEAVYLTLPVYVFLACSFISNLKDQNCITFLLSFYPCLILSTCFQRLLEVRYFIVPYIIARLRFPKSSIWLVVFEFLWYMAINVATFTVFFTKAVEWPEFEEIQRIIW